MQAEVLHWKQTYDKTISGSDQGSSRPTTRFQWQSVEAAEESLELRNNQDCPSDFYYQLCPLQSIQQKLHNINSFQEGL